MYGKLSGIFKMAEQFQPNQKVLRRIANVFYEYDSITKTSLHLASRLRWDSFMKYLEWLQANNYVIYLSNESAKTYALTQSGIEMFQKLTTFLDCIK